MQGTTHNRRGILAACLVVLFSLSPLAPLAAGAFGGASPGMSCCKTKGKCCCRKRSGENPQVATTACGDCGGADFGSASTMGPAAIRLQVLTPVISAAGATAPAAALTRSRISEYNLRQRPPPVQFA